MFNFATVLSGNKTHYICVLTIITALIGCSTATPYNVLSVDSYTYSQVQDGLKIAIHPIANKSDCKKYFGMDLLSSEILPVFVVAENRNPTSSFILTNDQFTLSNADNPIIDQSKVGDESNLVTLNNILGGSLIVLSMINDKLEDQQSIAEKEFRAKTLPPGSSTSGFVYFQMSKEKMSQGTWTVQIKVIKPKEQDTKIFNINFAL